MAQPVNAATPLDAVTVKPPMLLQVSAPEPGLMPIPRVTVVALSAVSTLPLVSCTVIDAAKLPVPVAWMLTPEAGWLVKTSLVAVPAVMLKLLALLGAVYDGLLEAVSV